MGQDTGIEWTDATWNPVRGCSRVSPGCENCYAEQVAARFSFGPTPDGPREDDHGRAAGPYHGLARIGKNGARWTGEVRMVPEHLADPLRWKKPRRIFVNSMSDLFHEKLTNEEIAAVFGVMAAAPRHTFQVLTKRAERMREWFKWADKRGEQGARLFPDDPLDWRIRQMCHVEARRAGVDLNADERQNHGGPWPLPNVWLGVSVEDQQRADERIPLLLSTPAVVRFISYEPALGPLRFLPSWVAGYDFSGGYKVTAPRLDWVIVGGESGPGARPFDVRWASDVVAQLQDTGVACFVKQMGSNVFDPATLSWSPLTVLVDEAQLTTRDGRHCASVWRNGTWHTFDANGIGGENASERSVYVAKRAVKEALVRQHIHPIKGWARHRSTIRDRKGGDMSEWPEDIRVRLFPGGAP